jgi:hypothetical protein
MSRFTLSSSTPSATPVYANTDGLRVKLKSLAAEARIIKAAERKVLRQRRKLRARGDGQNFDTYDLRYMQLRDHRKGRVRGAARTANLALGFLNGRAYAEVEQYTEVPPDFTKVEGTVHDFVIGYKYFGEKRKDEITALFKAWVDAAQAHIAATHAEDTPKAAVG